MFSQNENFVDEMEATNSDPGNQNRLNQIAKKYPNAVNLYFMKIYNIF
jgi:hypothetical protein